MKTLFKTLGVGAMVAGTPMAQAVEVGGGELSANVGVVSNYYFRGVTQTDDGAAVQGGVDWAHSKGFYVGAWGSNVDFGDKTSYELDVYTGWDFDHWLPEDFKAGVNTIYYAYPDADGDIDYWEVGASGGWRWISAGLQYTVWGDANDGAFQKKDIYYYGGLDFELPKDFGLSGLIGRYDFDDDGFVNADGIETKDYTHWKVGLSKDAGKFGTFSLNYEQTNGDVGETPAADDDPKGWVGWNVTFE